MKAAIRARLDANRAAARVRDERIATQQRWFLRLLREVLTEMGRC